jgi:nucleotide-binding universal stress UspA family protein
MTTSTARAVPKDGLVREVEGRMSIPTTILVPTDFGEPADAALDYAVAFARKLGSRVVLLHVLRPPTLGMGELRAVVTEGAVDSVFTDAQAALDKVASRHQWNIETKVRSGKAQDLILQVAAEVHADLIVMGTHGRHGFRRLLLGSVAEMIVRSASCPVLTMHSKGPLLPCSAPSPAFIRTY